MEGIFGANGGCGYVKKPDILLNVGPNNEVFDPRAIRPVQKILQVKGMCISIHIFFDKEKRKIIFNPHLI